MKKLSLLLSLLLCFAISFSQNQPIVQRSTPAVVASDARWQALYNMGAPRYADTLAANLQKGIDSCGAIIFTYDYNGLWYRQCSPKKWVPIVFNSSTPLCHGTELISGSATWSGTGLEYDVTDADYYIGCNHYNSLATTVTLDPADPSLDRIDVIGVDITEHVFVISGIPGVNPIAPQVNPLTQLSMTFVYVQAGSTTPSGEEAFIIYNSGVEWGPASDIAGIDFFYPTDPYTAPVSTYAPNAADGTFISYTYSTLLDINDYQYLKFYLRLNGALTSTSNPFLTISFYNNTTQSTQDFNVANGQYGFNSSTLNAWQLIVIPLSGMTIFSNSFDKLNIIVNGAPSSSFQLDKIYLLSGATVPPIISNAWDTQGNDVSTTSPAAKIGPTSYNDFRFISNNLLRMIISRDGIQNDETETPKTLLWDSASKVLSYTNAVRKFYLIPPLYRIDSSDNKSYLYVDTTQFVLDPAGSNTQIQYNNSGVFGASSGLTWTNASNRLTTGGDAVFGGVRIGHGLVPSISDNTVVGANGSLNSITTGFGNSAFGAASLGAVTTGSYNTAIGSGAGFVITTGQRNTSLGWGTLFEGGTVSTSFNTLVGFYAGRHIAGSTNTGLGYQVYGGQFGSPAQTGTNNNAFGANTGGSITSGNYNILIGDNAGANLTTGSNNIAIGQAGQFASATASDQLNIQNIIWGINNSATGSTASTGNIGIGTAAPDSMLTIERGLHVKRGVNLSGLPSGEGTKELRIDNAGNVSASSTKVLKVLLTQVGGDDPQSATSGLLDVGKSYTIDTYNSGDNFLNVGAPSNTTGISFIATGTTPTTWTNSSQLSWNGGCPFTVLLQNTVGNVWWEWNGNGSYLLMSDGLFTQDKTFILTGQPYNNGSTSTFSNQYGNSNIIQFDVAAEGVGVSNDLLTSTAMSMEIFQ